MGLQVMRVLMAVVVGFSLLAGCIGSPKADVDPHSGLLDPALRESLTAPVHDLLGHFQVTFTGATQTQLYIDYFRPDLPEGQKSPVILVFTPYQSAQPGEFVDGLPDEPYSGGLVDYYVPRGYTVAFADVRGNHRAGGCVDQTGPEQWQDGYDYVEWLGTQDWSSGKVGMWGVSYDAETQFTTAMMAPPHLTTIVPIASVSNQYEWNFYQGVPYEGQPLTGMGGYFAGSAAPSMNPQDAVLFPEKLECQQETFEAGLDFSGDMTTFWKERDYRPMAGQIKASVLHVHGLADWNVRPINIDPLFNDITSEKRGVFGLWHHATPDREDWGTLLHAWYDYWLLERENGILDVLPPVLIEDSTGQWHGLDAFPLLEQPWLELELSPDGALVEPGTADAGTRALHDQTTEAVMATPGSSVLGQAGTTATGYPTTLEFTWKTTEDLHLMGRPEVTFTATTDQRSTHWVAELREDGNTNCAYAFGNGTRNQSICQNVGYQDTRHLEGLDNPKDLQPGVPYEVTVRMFPQYDVIPAGSTLRLVIANNNADVQQDPTGAHNELLLGGDTRALLRLPLTPGSVLLPHDALPAIYPGYLSG